MFQELDVIVSAWIRETGLNPIMLGWAGSLVILAIWREWRGK